MHGPRETHRRGAAPLPAGRGLTLDQAGDRIGVSKATMSRIENGAARGRCRPARHLRSDR
ncbi:helix-turn-helix domain-containing protein [Actinophytocola sp.]|uniref:helix-turn-helix domain-containing protein n=1 Tax=Actinophytocola sp. TaxID=1872138 RepID=UPI0039C867C3